MKMIDIAIIGEVMIEFASVGDGHFICEYKKRKHTNYGGWKDDNINYTDYKEAVVAILEGKKQAKQ